MLKNLTAAVLLALFLLGCGGNTEREEPVGTGGDVTVTPEPSAVQAEVNSRCLNSESDFCTRAYALIAQWIAGEITDEEFVNQIDELRDDLGLSSEPVEPDGNEPPTPLDCNGLEKNENGDWIQRREGGIIRIFDPAFVSLHCPDKEPGRVHRVVLNSNSVLYRFVLIDRLYRECDSEETRPIREDEEFELNFAYGSLDRVSFGGTHIIFKRYNKEYGCLPVFTLNDRGEIGEHFREDLGTVICENGWRDFEQFKNQIIGQSDAALIPNIPLSQVGPATENVGARDQRFVNNYMVAVENTCKEVDPEP